MATLVFLETLILSLSHSSDMETHANGKMYEDVGKPTNPMVSSLLTDMYQFTMAYAYWKANKHLDRAV